MAGFGDDATGQDVMYADNLDFSGNITPTGQFTMDGQILIGSTAPPHLKVGTLTPGSGITITNASGSITISASGGGGTVTSVTGTLNRITSSGGATPAIDISAAYVGQTSITTLGTIATGVWNGSVIDLAHGGTNANLTASNGGIFYSSATAAAILAGTATAGQLLTSGSSTTPAWTTTTYPLTNAANTLLYASSANTMAALATANNSVLLTNGTGVPAYPVAPTITCGTLLWFEGVPVIATPSKYLYFYDDMLMGSIWNGLTSNSGVAVYFHDIDANHSGIFQIRTGGNSAGVGVCVGFNDQQGQLSNGITYWEALIDGGDQLPDGVNTFTLNFGLTDCTNTGIISNGLYFTFDRSVSTTNWLIRSSNASTTTSTTTSVAATAGSPTKFAISYNSSGTTATYYINGTSVGTISTNIPSSYGIGQTFSIKASAGTSNLGWFIDYSMLIIQFATPR